MSVNSFGVRLVVMPSKGDGWVYVARYIGEGLLDYLKFLPQMLLSQALPLWRADPVKYGMEKEAENGFFDTLEVAAKFELETKGTKQ